MRATRPGRDEHTKGKLLHLKGRGPLGPKEPQKNFSWGNGGRKLLERGVSGDKKMRNKPERKKAATIKLFFSEGGWEGQTLPKSNIILAEREISCGEGLRSRKERGGQTEGFSLRPYDIDWKKSEDT